MAKIKYIISQQIKWKWPMAICVGNFYQLISHSFENEDETMQSMSERLEMKEHCKL